MDDLHVDGQLTAVVVDDQDADGATAGLKGAQQAGPEVGLVNDGQALLDVTGLGHGDDVALLQVEDAVLLEDGAQHGLDDDARRGVRDERRLLVQLLGEEVDTEVAVLARGRRGGDADHLAGAALQDQDVANADVVARNGDGVAGHIVLVGAATARRRAATGADRLTELRDLDIAAFRIQQTVSKLVHALAERVVVACRCGKEEERKEANA